MFNDTYGLGDLYPFAGASVIGRVRPAAFGTQVEWLFVHGVERQALPVAGVRDGLDAAADRYAADLATRGGANVALLTVNNVNTPADYGRVVSYLERQSVLESVDVERPSPDAAALREKIIRKLRAGAMPPARAVRPDEATLTALAERLEHINDEVAQTAPNPGRPVVHRLNRAEYANAIRDLLGIEINGAAILPADDSSYGFDNVADVLSMSPGLLDRYLHAARTISRIAVSEENTA